MSDNDTKPANTQPAPKAGGSLTRGRHQARLRAVQALYQWELNPIAATALVQEYYSGQHDMKKVDADYFQALVVGCIQHQEELDACFGQYLKIDLNRLDPIERCVLRLATWELQHRLDVPRRVVINEGVEMAKTYGAADGHKFVNGVLDKAARDLRQHEQ